MSQSQIIIHSSSRDDVIMVLIIRWHSRHLSQVILYPIKHDISSSSPFLQHCLLCSHGNASKQHAAFCPVCVLLIHILSFFNHIKWLGLWYSMVEDHHNYCTHHEMVTVQGRTPFSLNTQRKTTSKRIKKSRNNTPTNCTFSCDQAVLTDKQPNKQRQPFLRFISTGVKRDFRGTAQFCSMMTSLPVEPEELWFQMTAAASLCVVFGMSCWCVLALALY